jgi:hypothetical protein
MKGQFHISTEELRSQVVEAEATTAASQKSKKPATPHLTEPIIKELDEEVMEEAYDSDLDELGW